VRRTEIHATPATTQRSSADRCAPTPIYDGPSPENTEGGPSSGHQVHWYVNADRTLWCLAADWEPGKNVKTAWFRDPRAAIEVTGRRLDATAPPLNIQFPPPDSYRHRFMPSGMTFPTAGCWEVTAKSDGHELKFVTRIK
jgi:hypothetical protein